MTDNQISDKEIKKYVFFLENLLIKLKNGSISNEEQRELSEFYINYMFKRENIENDEKKYEKYLCLGWYIYEILNKDIKDIKHNKDEC